MLRRVYLRSCAFTLPALSLVILCLIGWSSISAQSVGSQRDRVTTSNTASPPTATPEPIKRPSDDDISYRLGPGDLLEIKVINVPELTREVRIDNQGQINGLAYINGSLPAACLTEEQLRQVIVEKYTKYIKSPQVSVFIKEYNSQPVSVIGAVFQPKQFQLQRRVRLLDLISRVGGPSDKAGQRVFIIHSGEGSSCEGGTIKTISSDAPSAILKEFELRDVMNASANPYIEPGDIITVPEADQIFLTGSVKNPGPLALRGRTTLTEAINQVGGFAQDAAKKKISLSRLDPATHTRKETIYNLEDIKKNRAEDVVLQANDMIEVPNSTGSSTKRTIFTALAQTAGVLPLYTIIR